MKIKIIATALISIALTLAICFILLIPHKYHVTDGGSYGYEAKLYTIHVNQPGKNVYPESEWFVSVHIFPFIDLYIPLE